jgi:hypothetical protein
MVHEGAFVGGFLLPPFVDVGLEIWMVEPKFSKWKGLFIGDLKKLLRDK